ncbi:MAG: hypothetical protein ACLTHX_14245 [Blautia massiliensis (ex Durand et al. 2017)]|uniref:hypothetical protein n=1 Tax=Blautia massiliensis (ex Durand et al. 2017) TaxID=1737424 RepID=UPI0039912F5D
MKKRKSNSFRRNLNSVKRGVKSQAFQIRNSLSEIEKSLNKIASNEDIKNKKEKNKKIKKGVDFLQIITYNTTCLEERTKQKTKDKQLNKRL